VTHKNQNQIKRNLTFNFRFLKNGQVEEFTNKNVTLRFLDADGNDFLCYTDIVNQLGGSMNVAGMDRKAVDKGSSPPKECYINITKDEGTTDDLFYLHYVGGSSISESQINAKKCVKEKKQGYFDYLEKYEELSEEREILSKFKVSTATSAKSNVIFITPVDDEGAEKSCPLNDEGTILAWIRRKTAGGF